MLACKMSSRHRPVVVSIKYIQSLTRARRTIFVVFVAELYWCCVRPAKLHLQCSGIPVGRLSQRRRCTVRKEQHRLVPSVYFLFTHVLAPHRTKASECNSAASTFMSPLKLRTATQLPLPPCSPRPSRCELARVSDCYSLRYLLCCVNCHIYVRCA